MAMQLTTRVVLCRHGVTDFTTTGRWDGRGGSDPELNETGRHQAASLATRLASFLADEPEIRVVSSSLRRARETAEPAAATLGAEFIADPAWDELSFGEWDGLTGDEIRDFYPADLLRFWADDSFRVPGGESHLDLHARVRPAFERLLDGPGTTVVVAHCGPIMSCISSVLGMDLLSARRLSLPPTSMSAIASASNTPVVEFINDLGSNPGKA